MATPAKKTPTAKAKPKAAPSKAKPKATEPDQTPEEALVAKAEMDKHEGIEPDQTPEEAELTREIAETFEAVPQNKPREEVEAVPADSQKGNRIRVLLPGLQISGKVLKVGAVVEVSDSYYNASPEDQMASYGQVFYEKA